jgi:DNA processing protein
MLSAEQKEQWIATINRANMQSALFWRQQGWRPGCGAAVPKQNDALLSKQALSIQEQKRLDRVFAWNKVPSNKLVFYGDPDYPPSLQQLCVPPPVFFGQGNVSALQLPLLAVVGSRRATEAATAFAFEVAYRFAALGWGVVSGLALGVDAAAHQGALAANGVTVAVLPCGLDSVYPKRHTKLAAQIKRQGLVISEYPLDAGVYRSHFQQRNRLVSGLAQAVLVVEAEVCSGSLITARHALNQGRPLLARPGSGGCNQLIRQGACLVEGVSQVAEYLGVKMPLESVERGSQIKEEKLSEAEQALLVEIPFSWVSVGELMEKTKNSLGNVLSLLTELEIKGLVESSCVGVRRLDFFKAKRKALTD